MPTRRISTPVLIAIDLSLLVGSLLVLGSAISMAWASTGIEALPERANARVLAMELYAAQRQAVNSGEPVEVVIEPAGDRPAAYTIAVQGRPIGFYRLPNRREFQSQFAVSAAPRRIEFLPDGGVTEPAAIELAAPEGSWQVTVGTAGEVRIIEPQAPGR